LGAHAARSLDQPDSRQCVSRLLRLLLLWMLLLLLLGRLHQQQVF
jgi:hypothetical protein